MEYFSVEPGGEIVLENLVPSPSKATKTDPSKVLSSQGFCTMPVVAEEESEPVQSVISGEGNVSFEDSNGDGVISDSEISFVDTNGDGEISTIETNIQRSLAQQEARELAPRPSTDQFGFLELIAIAGVAFAIYWLFVRDEKPTSKHQQEDHLEDNYFDFPFDDECEDGEADEEVSGGPHRRTGGSVRPDTPETPETQGFPPRKLRGNFSEAEAETPILSLGNFSETFGNFPETGGNSAETQRKLEKLPNTKTQQKDAGFKAESGFPEIRGNSAETHGNQAEICGNSMGNFSETSGNSAETEKYKLSSRGVDQEVIERLNSLVKRNDPPELNGPELKIEDNDFSYPKGSYELGDPEAEEAILELLCNDEERIKEIAWAVFGITGGRKWGEATQIINEIKG